MVRPVHIPRHKNIRATPVATVQLDRANTVHPCESWSELVNALDATYRLLSEPRRQPFDQFLKPSFLLLKVEARESDVLPLPLDLGFVESRSGE